MLPNLHYWQCYASSGPTGLARGVLKTLGFVKAVGRLMLPEAAKLRAELHEAQNILLPKAVDVPTVTVVPAGALQSVA